MSFEQETYNRYIARQLPCQYIQPAGQPSDTSRAGRPRQAVSVCVASQQYILYSHNIKKLPWQPARQHWLDLGPGWLAWWTNEGKLSARFSIDLLPGFEMLAGKCVLCDTDYTVRNATVLSYSVLPFKIRFLLFWFFCGTPCTLYVAFPLTVNVAALIKTISTVPQLQQSRLTPLSALIREGSI